jgi:glycosyltransferase involved in cell wall biosynthesis
VLDSLRALGHQIRWGDVDLYGAQKMVVAAATFAPQRRRWWTRYHLGGPAFRARSWNARRHARATRDIDLIFQFGATFAPPRSGPPLVLFCDGNMALSRYGATQGVTDGTFLTPAEMDRVQEREQRVYRQATAILTISERVRRSFIEDCGIDPHRVRTVYAAPNLYPDESWQPYDANLRPPRILFIGRQFDRKGGDVLVAAFRKIRAEGVNASLTIIGPRDLDFGDPDIEVLGLIDKDTPEGKARLIQAYESARVFCVPSRFEGLSIAFLEAMLFGVPCVGAASPWVEPEMIVDLETGFVVPVDDVDALAARLRRVIEDPDLANRMGDLGRRRALELFTWPRVAQAMTAAFDDVVAGRIEPS